MIRIGIQPNVLDPDPDEMNADPQPYAYYLSELTVPLGDGEYVCAGSARQHALYIWEKAVGNLVKILHGNSLKHSYII